MEYTAVYVRDRVHFGVEQPLASRLDAYNAIDIARMVYFAESHPELAVHQSQHQIISLHSQMLLHVPCKPKFALR